MSSKNKQALPTDRSFGLLFATVFALLSAFAVYQGGGMFRVYGWLFAAILVGLMAVLAPSSLRPFNKAWMKLGEWMGAVVSPLVLAFIFFVIITPVALISRIS